MYVQKLKNQIAADKIKADFACKFTYFYCYTILSQATPNLGYRSIQGLPQRGGGMETNFLQVLPGGKVSPPPELVRSTHERCIT